MKVIFLVFLFLAPIVFPQKVYNYVGRSTTKLQLPNDAQVRRDGNNTFYSWFNESGFYFFLARNGTVVTARRDLLVSTENEAAQLWATVSKEIMADGFYPVKTDIGDATFKNSKGISAAVWWEWNEDQLMYAVIASFE